MDQQIQENQIQQQLQQIYQINPEKLTTPGIEGYDFNKGVNYSELIKKFATFGLQAQNLHEAIHQVNRMIRWRLSDEPNLFKDDPDFTDAKVREQTRCTIFLGYTSNMVSSGIREIIRYLVQHKMVDCIVSSAGGIEEDLMKCLSDFHVGTWNVDDKQCRLKAINRIGNIFVPSENYGKLEDWLMPIFKYMYEEQSKNHKVWSPSSMIQLFGERINDERSIYYWAAKNNIPVFCPALTDGAIGDMMFYFNYKEAGLICDILQDVCILNKIAMKAKKSGVIILGGGVVKHHILNANIWRNGADFAVYINTGVVYDGSDSGATASEGISWGKLKIDSNYVKIWGEASIIFPLLVAETFAKHHDLAKRN